MLDTRLPETNGEGTARKPESTTINTILTFREIEVL
jgi:hypothetical protein